MRPRHSPTRPLLLDAAFLPEDFPERLALFKEAAGLSWEGMAACMGIDPRQVMRWRRDTRPSGDALFALFLLAARVPGGVCMLLGAEVSPSAGAFQPAPAGPAADEGASQDGEQPPDVQPVELIRSAMRVSSGLEELFPRVAEALRREDGEG